MNRQNLIEDSDVRSSSVPSLNLVKQHKSFDYEALDRQTQLVVKQKTTEIKGLIRQTARDIFCVGQKLAEVKQQLKHGEFRNWLKTEFNWSVSSANKFMQVSEQFQSANFMHLNFATSALYVLAAPSTPEEARQQALKLATRGEFITYSLANIIIKHHKELAEDTPCLSKTADTDNKPTIDVSTAKNIKPAERSIRIVDIKQAKSRSKNEEQIQDFEIVYAGVRIAVKGSPKDLTILFEQMQNNPQFAKDIFERAKFLCLLHRCY